MSRTLREQKQLVIAEMILTEATHRGPSNWHDDEPLHTTGDKVRGFFGARGAKRNPEVDDYREGVTTKRAKSGGQHQFGAPPSRISHDKGTTTTLKKPGAVRKFFGAKDKWETKDHNK